MAVTEQRAVTLPDGGRVAYEVRADGSAGLPILALHGVLVGTSNYVHQMLRLPQFRWIAPALRGHGDSSPAGDEPSIEQAVRDVIAVLDAEGVDRAVILGNSLGATVGLAIGLYHPERALALVLVEPSVPALLPDRGNGRLTSAAERARPLLAAGRIDEALEIFLKPRVGPDWKRKVGRRRLEEWRRNVHSTPAWFDAVERFDPGVVPLAGIDLPTLLVNGAGTQPEYRELTLAVADAMPFAEWIEVPDAGHGVPADNPEAFNELLVGYLQRIGLIDQRTLQSR